MANGTYGTKRPAFVTSSDVEIFYLYRPNRNTDSPDFSNGYKRIDSSILSQVNAQDENGYSLGTLPGVYNLKLPLSEFNKPGVYSVYIRPRELSATITDVSTLAAVPDVRGIVVNTADVSNSEDSSVFNNGGLVGYRVEYLDDNNQRSEEYRLITSSNRCEPVAQNLNDSMQKGIRYRFNDSSNLIFCTVTPATAMSFKSSSTPYIGKTSQRIRLINTKFNPVMLEIELTEHDIETLTTMVEGDQIRNLDKALITTFNQDGEIYSQAYYGHEVNKATGLNADFKINSKDSIDNGELDKYDEIKEHYRD